MGSGTTKGCIWLGSARRMGPVVADNTLWSRKGCGGDSLLALAVVGGGGTGVGKGENWEGAVRDCVHRTHVGTVGNMMMAQVLDECNSPSLPKCLV